MKTVNFNLLRRKAVDVHARRLAGRVFIFAVTAALAAIVVCMFIADPVLVGVCKRLPRWCAEAGLFFNRFGNGYNVFPPLAAAVVLLACTVRLKLTRSAHAAITTLAVRLIFLLAVIGIPSLVTTLAKWVFGRMRPQLSQHTGGLDFSFFTWSYNGMGLSFPSGHTTVAFSAAFALGTLLPQFRIPLFVLAALVGAARVVLGAHYPSDVIAGALCAGVVASLVSRAFARQRLGLVVTTNGAIEPKPWPRLGRFAALAATLFGALRGRPPAPRFMQTAGPV